MATSAELGAGKARRFDRRASRDLDGSELREDDPERAGAVAFLLRGGFTKYATRVRHCARAGLGEFPCNLPAFCRPCTWVAQNAYADRVVALCALALSANPHIVFLAGDFTVGVTRGMREGVRLVKRVLARVRRTRSKAWKKVVGLIYSIEIGRSRSGEWWIHAHTFLAVDGRDQPSTRKSLARAWARSVRVLRWPKEPFDPRSGRDKLFEKLMKHQKVKPLRAYRDAGLPGQVLPIPAIEELEPDLRGRARYLRERNGEPGHERALALTGLSESDRLAILRARFRLNARSGVFKLHGEAEVKALTATIRGRRLRNLSIRSRRDSSLRIGTRARLLSTRRVPPSSPAFRARLRSRFSQSTRCLRSSNSRHPP
jgi:hypothetical protein